MTPETPSESLAREALETLPLSTATLDHDGVVVDTNRAWREFGVENGISGPPDAMGVSYLEVTDTATEDGDDAARRAASGLREVLSGSRERFVMEYPCHSPTERRWFLLRAAPVDHDDERYAVSRTSASPTGSSRSGGSSDSTTRPPPSASGSHS